MQALVVAVAFFGGNLLVYTMLTRALPRANRLILFFLLGSVAGMLLLGFELASNTSTTIRTLASALTYALMCAVFLSCFGMSLTSISASLLLRLRIRGMEEAEISDMYSSGEMVTLRLERMVHSGYLEEGGGHFQLTGKGRRMVRAFQFFQRLFRHEDPS